MRLLFLASMGAWAGPAEVREAEALYRQTRYTEALRVIGPSIGGNDFEALMVAGKSAMGAREFKKAVELFERATQARSGDAKAWHWLGRAYGRRAETAFPLAMASLASKARQHFEKAVAIDPRNYEALEDLFTFYVMAPGFMGGGRERAEGLLSKFDAIGAAEGEYARARLEEDRKQFQNAETHWKRAADLAPKSIGRILDVARFFVRRGRVTDSLTWVGKAEKVSAQSPEVLFGKAEVLIAAKQDLPLARALLEAYLKAPLTPELPSRDEAEKLLKKTR